LEAGRWMPQRPRMIAAVLYETGHFVFLIMEDVKNAPIALWRDSGC
jgi:hypothetical protein